MAYRLIYENDGWRFKEKQLSSGYDPAFSPAAVAHDIIEHHSIKEIGTYHDEFRAVGASWYTRGQWADYPSRRVNPYDALKGDVEYLLESMDVYGKGLPAGIPIVTSDFEEEFTDVVGSLIIPVETKQNIIHLMNAGVNAAMNRFEKYGRFTANTLFHKIEDALEPIYSKGIGGFSDYELLLNLDYHKDEVSLQIHPR